MPEPTTPEAVAHELLADGIRALAHESSVVASLDTILGAVSERLRIASAVVVVRDPALESLVVVASVGLLEPALTGLTQAMASKLILHCCMSVSLKTGPDTQVPQQRPA